MRRLKMWALCSFALVQAAVGVQAQPETGAEEAVPVEEPGFFSGFSIMPGVTMRMIGVRIDRDGGTAYMLDDEVSWSLHVKTRDFDFGKSQLGVFYEAHVGSFETGDQLYNEGGDEGKDYHDVGTSLEGHYSYVASAFYYKFRDGHGKGNTKIGLGLALWQTDLSGNAILTPDERPERGMPITSVNGRSRDELGEFLFYAFEADNNWYYRFTMAGTTFDSAGSYHEVSDLALTVGYRFGL